MKPQSNGIEVISYGLVEVSHVERNEATCIEEIVKLMKVLRIGDLILSNLILLVSVRIILTNPCHIYTISMRC